MQIERELPTPRVGGLGTIRLLTFALAGTMAVCVGYKLYDSRYLSNDVKGFLRVCVVDPTATVGDQQSYLRMAQAHIHTKKDANTVQKVAEAERLFDQATSIVAGEHMDANRRFLTILGTSGAISSAESSAINKQDESDTEQRKILANIALRSSEELYAEVRATMGLPPTKFYDTAERVQQ